MGFPVPAHACMKTQAHLARTACMEISIGVTTQRAQQGIMPLCLPGVAHAWCGFQCSSTYGLHHPTSPLSHPNLIPTSQVPEGEEDGYPLLEQLGVDLLPTIQVHTSFQFLCWLCSFSTASLMHRGLVEALVAVLQVV